MAKASSQQSQALGPKWSPSGGISSGSEKQDGLLHDVLCVRNSFCGLSIYLEPLVFRFGVVHLLQCTKQKVEKQCNHCNVRKTCYFTSKCQSAIVIHKSACLPFELL